MAIAFFIAEMGDKTQLATVTLAAKFQSVIPVLAGTTIAMLIADAIGIVIGINLGKKIPERAVKWVAALIFIFFGAYGLYESVPPDLLTVPVVIGGAALILLSVAVVGRGDLVKLFHGSLSS